MDYFTLFLKNMMDASENQDGIMLQKTEANIIDAYKEKHINHHEYEVLIGVNQIFMSIWRKEEK